MRTKEDQELINELAEEVLVRFLEVFPEMKTKLTRAEILERISDIETLTRMRRSLNL